MQPSNDSARPLQNDGRRPPTEGPPDLDQMWRDFTARLGRLFGGKGGPGGFKNDPRGTVIGAAIITVVLLLLWVLSGYFVVPEGQTAVVTTFGKFTRTTSVGVNWRWPYPIQNSEIVNLTELKKIDIGGTGSGKPTPDSLMLTSDENVVGVQFVVQYKIKDAAAWLFNNSEAEGSIKQVAETAVREQVGKNKMDDILSSGHERLAADINNSMQQMLDHYAAGVQVTSINILAIQPPGEVQPAFDEVQKAQQDKERFKSEGQTYAADAVPRATSKAAVMAQEAATYNANVQLTAESDVARFNAALVEYKKAPVATRDRMYLDTMQQIFTNSTKVMVDAKAGSSLIYLPIDKILAQSQANYDGPKGTVTITTPVQADPTPTAPTDMNPAIESQKARDARSRETRDREGR